MRHITEVRVNISRKTKSLEVNWLCNLLGAILLLFLSGCQGVDVSETTGFPRTITVTMTAQPAKTATPTSTISPTATLITPVTTASCTGQQKKVLIIERYSENTGFLYVENEGKLQFLDEGVLPVAFSPYGEKLLVVINTTREIGIADWDGKNLWMIPQPESGRACKAAWLSEDELLVSVCTNVDDPAYDDDRTYIFDLKSREYRIVGQDVIRRVQAISPRGDLWFALGDQLYLERKDGTETPVDYLPTSSNYIFPLSQPALVFSPNGDMLYFMKWKTTQKGANLFYELYGSSINAQQLQPEELIYSGFPGSGYVMKISPDGKYMAVVVADNDLFIINLKTKQIDYQMDWPNKKSWPPFIYWSPDSQRLGFSPEVERDIVYSMDVATGEKSILLSDAGDLMIVDWRCVTGTSN